MRYKLADFVDSDSDGTQDEDELSPARYRTAHISSALLNRSQFARAVAELTSVLELCKFTDASHELQTQLLADIHSAVELCERSHQHRAAVKALVQCTQRALPRAKAGCISRTWKARAVLLTREERKLGTKPLNPPRTDDAQPVQLPMDVVEQVLALLPPLTLATAACVCQQWRELASADCMWQPYLAGNSHQQGAQQHFAALISGRDEAALRWCARRAIVGGTLQWRDPESGPPLPLSRPSLRVHYPSVSEAVRFVCNKYIAADFSSEEEEEDPVQGLGWLHINSAAPV